MAGTAILFGLVGAAGRMGQAIVQAANGRSDVRIGGAFEHTRSAALGQDVGTLAGLDPVGVPVTSDLVEGFSKVDVVVDLSLASATIGVIEAALKAKVPLLCGTTAVDEETLLKFAAAASDIPVLYTPNLSLGVAVTRELVGMAVAALGPDFDIEIEEMHHRNKVDAPSGTAKALAEAAAAARGLSMEKHGCFGRNGQTGVRPAAEIGVHALRGGGVFGYHKVILAGEHETIEISHRASSRALFAEGALRAALFLAKKTPGQYGMKDVLKGV